MPSIRFDRITLNLDTGRIATEETGASYEFATTSTLNAGLRREGIGIGFFQGGVRIPSYRSGTLLSVDGDSSRGFDSTRALWITGVRASPWFVRACVRAAHVRATIETAAPCHSPFLVPSVNRLHEPRDPIPLSGAPPLGQTERPRSIYLVHGSPRGETEN